MKQRNPIAVFLLPIVTFGIYSWYWLVKTKGEMNSRGENIPTAWIWLIPFVGTIWWLWKYSEGVEHVSGGKLSGVIAFILIFLLGNIGEAIIQNTFNEVVAVEAAPSDAPAQPVNQPQVYNQPTEQPTTLEPSTSAPVEEAPVNQSPDQSQF